SEMGFELFQHCGGIIWATVFAWIISTPMPFPAISATALQCAHKRMKTDARRPIRHMLATWIARLNQPIAPSSRVWRYGLVLILSVYAITTLAHSLTVPVFEGSDEQRHYAYARYLVNERT